MNKDTYQETTESQTFYNLYAKKEQQNCKINLYAFFLHFHSCPTFPPFKYTHGNLLYIYNLHMKHDPILQFYAQTRICARIMLVYLLTSEASL